MVLDSADEDDRTYLFCSNYDNGSTDTSPSVKLQSQSPEPPLVFGFPLVPFGGPCDDDTVACLDDGMPAAQTNQGVLCGGDHAVCGDPALELCDACPVVGGVTTGDEMFILLGSFYCPDGCSDEEEEQP